MWRIAADPQNDIRRLREDGERPANMPGDADLAGFRTDYPETFRPSGGRKFSREMERADRAAL